MKEFRLMEHYVLSEVEKVPPAPWSIKGRKAAPVNYSNREALADIRDSLQDAMNLDPKGQH